MDGAWDKEQTHFFIASTHSELWVEHHSIFQSFQDAVQLVTDVLTLTYWMSPDSVILTALRLLVFNPILTLATFRVPVLVPICVLLFWHLGCSSFLCTATITSALQISSFLPEPSGAFCLLWWAQMFSLSCRFIFILFLDFQFRGIFIRRGTEKFVCHV